MFRLPSFLLLFGLAAPLGAQNAAETPVPTPEVAPIKIENRRVFDVGPSGNGGAAARATRINRRLQTLVEREADLPPFAPSDVQKTAGGYLIELGGVAVSTVSPRDGEDAGQSARELALQQGAQLARAVREARASRQNPLRGAGILISNSLRDLIASFFRWLPRVFAALLLFGVFWILARLARAAARRGTKSPAFDPNLRALILAISFYGVWFGGFLAILSALGLDSSSLAAAVGVSGFVLGFAFKDILSHFLAGILLLVSGKIRIGDQIVVREWEGTVERIELRALELRTHDNRLVIIPNGDVFSAPITSNSSAPHRKRTFTIPIGRQNDLESALSILENAVKTTPGVLPDPPPDVAVEQITGDAIVLRARFATLSTRSDLVSEGSACLKNAQIALREAGFSGPMPVALPESR